MPLKRIADSTVRRLSLYLRFLEEFENAGLTTISSEELAARGGTTSAQVRKDLSFFGSFGKRGLGYQVAELTQRMRRILGLERDWRVIIVGIGKDRRGARAVRRLPAARLSRGRALRFGPGEDRARGRRHSRAAASTRSPRTIASAPSTSR